MTIRHLQIFTAVADEMGMSAAAKKLHISQPTVSQAVGELEKYYGVKLFERLSRKLYLTREGELMLSFSRHILDSFEQMEEAMELTAKKPNLRVGCSVTVGTCLINDILDLAKIKMPRVSFNIMVANSSKIEEAILDNEVDVGIVEGIIKSKDLLTFPISKDELVVVCGKNHPLAGKAKITPDMLDGQNYISRESGSAERNQLEKVLEEQGLQLVRTFLSTNTEAMKNAVIRGNGIAIFSSRMIEKERADGSIVVLPIDGVRVTRNIKLVIHKNKYLTENIKCFQSIAREAF